MGSRHSFMKVTRETEIYGGEERLVSNRSSLNSNVFHPVIQSSELSDRTMWIFIYKRELGERIDFLFRGHHSKSTSQLYIPHIKLHSDVYRELHPRL